MRKLPCSCLIWFPNFELLTVCVLIFPCAPPDSGKTCGLSCLESWEGLCQNCLYSLSNLSAPDKGRRKCVLSLCQVRIPKASKGQKHRPSIPRQPLPPITHTLKSSSQVIRAVCLREEMYCKEEERERNLFLGTELQMPVISKHSFWKISFFVIRKAVRC